MRPLGGIGRCKRLFRENFVQILADDAGVHYHHLVMYQGGNDAVGVELQVIRVELLLCPKIEQVSFEVEAFFGDAQLDLLAAGGVDGVIEFQHSRRLEFSVSSPAGG